MKLTRLAKFVIGLGIYGIVMTTLTPWLVETRTHVEFRSVGLESGADRVANAELRAALPALWTVLVLSVVGVGLGVGLLHRREWARRSWLIACVVWLGVTLYFALPAPGWGALFPIGLRLFVLIYSFRVLREPPIRALFLENSR